MTQEQSPNAGVSFRKYRRGPNRPEQFHPIRARLGVGEPTESQDLELLGQMMAIGIAKGSSRSVEPIFSKRRYASRNQNHDGNGWCTGAADRNGISGEARTIERNFSRRAKQFGAPG
jgi:hypothetical protein